MSKFKILVKITGSIAAYKSAYLISKLIQDDFEVKVAVTESALKFIGEASLEGLTGEPVFKDVFEPGKMMSHINIAKWADLTIVAPADANTINKFANGIADNLVTSLFLAHNWSKPYLIAPAMNTAMLNHPATRESLKRLKKWGVKILPTGVGKLACGDEGEGKLLEPDRIYGYILNELNSHGKNKLNIAISGGATIEQIDKIRFISNVSTGRTAAALADYFFREGCQVTLLKGASAAGPAFDVDIIEFQDFSDLKNKLQNLLSSQEFDAVIHLAAVSDFTPDSIEFNGSEMMLPLENKLDSKSEEIKIKFRRNEKILNRLKEWSLNKEIKIVAFKFLEKEHSERKGKEIAKLFNSADWVVFNSLEGREGTVQKKFEFLESKTESKRNLELNELAKVLLNKIRRSK